MLKRLLSTTYRGTYLTRLASPFSRLAHSVAIDGNTAAAYVAYSLSDFSFGYPITPSSPAFEIYEKTVAKREVNALNLVPGVTVMHSEAGVAAALHGAAETGCLSTSFTSSQGLSLMIPEMYKLSTSGLPVVVHVAARALTRTTYNISGDHSDIMPVRSSGMAIISSSSVQECHDLGLASHLTAIDTCIPVCHFYDGFRTSHEMCKIEKLDYSEIAKLVDWPKIAEFRRDALSAEHGRSRIGVVNNDVGMQWQEAAVPRHLAFPAAFQKALDKIGAATGRKYQAYDYYGAKNPDYVVVVMGSAANTSEEAVEILNKEKNMNLGVVKVRLYRPWSNELFMKSIPKSAKKIAVLDRTREIGAEGEPLYLDVQAAFSSCGDTRPVINGIYGIGGKEFTPVMLESVFNNLTLEKPIQHFTVGIVDDVMHKSLPLLPPKDLIPPGTKQCMFWGLAADGTVGANQEAISIITNSTKLFTQGYFLFEAKKSGGWTNSHVRIGPSPIKAEYEIQEADYLAVSQQSFLDRFPHIFDRIRPNGIIVTNTSAQNLEEYNKIMPPHLKKLIAERNVKVFNIDASTLARNIGLGGYTNMLMQTVFFIKTEIMDPEKAINLLSDAIRQAYSHKGPKVIDKNLKAVQVAKDNLLEINYNKDEWLASSSDYLKMVEKFPNALPIVKSIFFPTMAMEGNSIPVSKFVPVATGKVPNATSQYEKRNLTHQVPAWDPKKCDTCNQCVAVCPHGVIRSYLVTPEESKASPVPMETRSSVNVKGFDYSIQFSPYDCMGCSLCAEICGRDAMHMLPRGEVNLDDAEKGYLYARSLPNRAELARQNLRGINFRQPLLEYSGACMGCTQSIYQRLLTQLFGHRMSIANPASCSVVYSSYFPSMPYVNNPEGHGPAYQSTLFEDAAEVTYGMARSTQYRRELLYNAIQDALKNPGKHKGLNDNGIALFKEWIENFNDGEKTYKISSKIKDYLKENYRQVPVRSDLADDKYGFDHPKNILGLIHANDDIITKQSYWNIGGDGFAYDIGYGGLDHCLADPNTDMNVMVLDNEFYANTGYQVSKSTPHGAVVPFATTGNLRYKKDLGRLFMTYGHIYIGSISIGANATHAINCIKEAEAYPGPSIILSYSPCLGHNIDGTMAQSLRQQRLAVKSGYWSLYSFNPLLKKKGKNPFVLTSKKPDIPVSDFIYNEGRYLQLKRANPDHAKLLHTELQEYIDDKWKILENLSKSS